MTWTPFWFEGNLAFGLVDSIERWEEIRAAYKEHAPTIDLLTAKHDIRKSKHYPCFGFYAEYKDEPTLGEWTKEHDMKL